MFFFMANNLVRNKIISLSTAESKYIVVGSCYSQLLWMKQILLDYGIELDNARIDCDNTSTINISKNLVQHSRTKHNDIRHYLIKNL